MKADRSYRIPSLLRIIATDGHVAFLVGMGLGLTVFLALVWAVASPVRERDVAEASTLAWHWLTVLAPQALLVLPALLWARSIQAVFRRGVTVSGRVTRQRVGLYGLLVVEFSYLADGRQYHKSNHLVPRDHIRLLTPDTDIEVLVSESRFPGPLIRDAYGDGRGGAR